MVLIGKTAWCALMNRKTRSGSPCSPARTRLPPLTGYRTPGAGAGSHRGGELALRVRPWSHCHCACQRRDQPDGSRSQWIARLVRTPAAALQAFARIRPTRPSAAGTQADTQLENTASATPEMTSRASTKSGCPQLHTRPKAQVRRTRRFLRARTLIDRSAAADRTRQPERAQHRQPH